MKMLNEIELSYVAGGNIADPNSCSSAVYGAAGVGALVGGVIGGAASKNPVVAGIAGLVGVVAATYYTLKNNPVCAPVVTLPAGWDNFEDSVGGGIPIKRAELA